MFDSLASAAVEAGLPDIARQVDEAKGMEEERREKAAAEIIAEVLPVMANSVRSGKAALEGTPMIPSEVANEPRWAIVNLRKALAELDSSDLPLNRQHRIEAASLEAARAELEHVAEVIVKSGLKDVKDSQKLAQDKLQSWMWQWLQALSARLRSDIDAMRRRKEEYEANIRSPASAGLRPTGPALRAMKKKIEQETDQLLYLNLLPPEKLALIAILETMRLAGTGGVTDGMKTLRAIMQIGKAVEAEYRITSLQDAMGKNPSNWLRSLQSGNGSGQQPLTRRQIDSVWKRLGRKIKDHTDAESKALAEGEYKQLGEFIQRTEGNPNVYEAAMIAPLRNVWTPAWTQHIHTALGSTLLNALVEEAKVVRNVTDENGNEQ
jgi:DNA-directed RNA polymerase